MSIQDFRRGYGPVKSRAGTWVAPSIAPKPPGPIAAEMRTDFPPHQELLWSNPATVNEWRVVEWSNESDGSTEDFSVFELLDNSIDLGDSLLLDPSLEIFDFEQLSTNYSSYNNDTTYGLLDTNPSPSISGFHVALPNSLELSPYEHEALRHYQTTYSLYRTTKDPNWSTHKVLLCLGAHEKMIMHLLLAVSLNDYSTRAGSPSSCQEAKNNFRAGAQLFMNASSSGLRTDEAHVVTMGAYFFFYLYMSKQKSIAPWRLSQLSLRVLNYVKKYDLLTSCLVSHASPDSSHSNSNKSSHIGSLLARLIMWTLDEDVKCSFQGSEGHYARHLASCDAMTKDIYDMSRTALGDFWCDIYPPSQARDDERNSEVLDFLWALMPLWQDINDLSREPDPSRLKSRIEQKFIFLRKVCGHLVLVIEYSNCFRNTPRSLNFLPRLRSLVLEFSSMQTLMLFFSMLSECTTFDRRSTTSKSKCLLTFTTL